jgi:iron(III) transport system ATP-binding protein
VTESPVLDKAVPVGQVSPTPVVRVRQLVKRFRRSDGTIVPAVDGVSFDVSAGEFVVLLGPSGCGKTTLLRCVAGLDLPDAGSIELEGRPVFSAGPRLNVPPERRKLSMIFQSYALWPHMSVFDNVAYPLYSRKAPRGEIPERVNRVLSMVGLSALATMYPGQLSGGQQQRIALARALAPNDKVVLFDEPLSNVDAKVREQLRLQFLSMQRELGFSALYVTHDQIEAMELAHRIAVMGEGQIVQFASPLEIYSRPASRYVANFIGKANELGGTVVSNDGAQLVKVATGLGEVIATAASDHLEVGAGVVVVCRPEACQVSSEQPAGPNRWRGVVGASLFLGSHTEHVIELDGVTFRLWQPGSQLLDKGAHVWVSVGPEHVRTLLA